MFNDNNKFIGTFDMTFKLVPEGKEQLAEQLYVDPDLKKLEKINSQDLDLIRDYDQEAIKESREFMKMINEPYVEQNSLHLTAEGLPGSPIKKQVEEPVQEPVENCAITPARKHVEEPIEDFHMTLHEVKEHPNPR